MINFAHLPSIVPGFQRPEKELLGEIIGMRNKGIDDLPVIRGWYDDSELDELKATIDSQKPTDGIDHFFGMMDPVETWTMVGIIRAMQPSTIFEIGTGKGIVTKYLADAAPRDATVYTLDVLPTSLRSGATRWGVNLWNQGYVKHNDADVGSAYRRTDAEDKIQQLIGDVGRFDLSAYYGTMDIVLVDADHDFECQTKALREAFNLVSPGGLIAVDDYGRLHHLQGPLWSVLTTAMGEPSVLRTLDLPQGSKAWYHVADSKAEDITVRAPASCGLIVHPDIPEARRNYETWVRRGTELS